MCPDIKLNTVTEVEEAVLHWSGKPVKAVKHTQLSTFIYLVF